MAAFTTPDPINSYRNDTSYESEEEKVITIVRTNNPNLKEIPMYCINCGKLLGININAKVKSILQGKIKVSYSLYEKKCERCPTIYRIA